jgi:hypothetical protein
VDRDNIESLKGNGFDVARVIGVVAQRVANLPDADIQPLVEILPPIPRPPAEPVEL